MYRIISEPYFSSELCKLKPNYLFVFGDNLLKKGTKGQASIRYHKNTFGIPTKKTPSMDENAFFTDADYDSIAAIYEDSFSELRTRLLTNPELTIVFPTAGLGTGLAQLNQRAPLIFELLNKKILELKNEFNPKSITDFYDRI